MDLDKVPQIVAKHIFTHSLAPTAFPQLSLSLSGIGRFDELALETMTEVTCMLFIPYALLLASTLELTIQRRGCWRGEVQGPRKIGY